MKSKNDLLPQPSTTSVEESDQLGYEIIARALSLMDTQARRQECFNQAKYAGEFFCLRLGLLEREVFAVAFLTTEHILIEYEELFLGTISTAPIYPREVVKRCLEFNASAIIIAHNHPSGSLTPSMADRQITKTLIEALQLIDVRILDHLIVARNQWLSFVEEGLF